MLKEKCKGKIAYASQAEAEAARRSMKKDFRRTGGGKGLRKLNSYACDECGQWHIGHSSRKGVQLQKVEAPKIPSDGQLRRRLRNIDARLDKERLHRAHVLGLLIQRQAAEEAARDRAQLQETLAFIYAPLRPEDV